MKSKNDIFSILESIDIDPISYREERPYILLDGILKSAHNTLLNVAIGRAANEVYGYNVGYLCRREDVNHYSDRIYQKFGIYPFEIEGVNPMVFKLKGFYQGVLGLLSSWGDVLNISINDVEVGDLIYDSIIRNNNNVYTIEDSSIYSKIKEIGKAYKLEGRLSEIFESNNIRALVLSHKVYTSFGVPARVATSFGATFISKSRAHLNRITSMEGHYRNDYALEPKDIDEIINYVGIEEVKSYVKKRFDGNAGGHDVKFAYENKEEYKESHLKKLISVEEGRPIAVIAPHAFSDGPHCDRKMVYTDYYQWFVQTLDITRHNLEVKWLVKPHPSSELYNEKGVVEDIVDKYDHVDIVPSDVKTDSVLSIADYVLTVRGTIGMEALLFDCSVITSGNSIYEDIKSVKLCTSEDEYIDSICKIDRVDEIPREDKRYSMSILYYRNKSYHYVTDLFGPERAPGLTAEENKTHDFRNIKNFAKYIGENTYQNDNYYRQLLDFFRNDLDRLSILNID
jgi:hypothetical protein